MGHFLKKLAEGDVFWMFSIAGLGMLSLCVTLVMVVNYGVPKGSAELLGVIVTLIGGHINTVINSIRARWKAKEGEEL